MIVQYLINIIKPVIQYEIPEDGIISRALIRTISQFQSIHLRFQHPDGVNEDQAPAWDTLAKAYSLDADAAIKACSWGNVSDYGI
ncbi:N-acetylmuramidase domain-containing protein [Phytobacter ursingii]